MTLLYRLAVACGVTVLLGSAAQAEDWQLAKDEGGIKVWLSEVAGSKYKAYRGVTTVEAGIDRVRALQEDVAGACAWIYECESQKLLKHEGAQAWTYSRFKTPWPVTPRDSVLLVTTQQQPDGSIRRTLHGLPDYVPAEKGYQRVAGVEGFWQMTPKGPGRTEVTYQVHTDPGGSVPSWVSNKFVVDAPFNTLKALKERAARP